MNTEKACCHCKVLKPLERYSKCKSYKDGLQIICKDCVAEQNRKPEVIAWRKAWAINYRKTEHGAEVVKRNAKKFIQSEKGKAKIARRRKKYDEKYPGRMKIHNAIKYKIKKGEMKKEPCRECGEVKVDAHHEDYSKPFDVIWLCRRHHIELHRSKADSVI